MLAGDEALSADDDAFGPFDEDDDAEPERVDVSEWSDPIEPWRD